MPPSIAEADEYISLCPMIWPLVAFRLKNGSPLVECSNELVVTRF